MTAPERPASPPRKLGPVEPAACRLDPDARRLRREALRTGLLACVEQARPLPDGWALALPLAREAQARAFVAFEERCCRFARYGVQRDVPAGLAWLEIRGPEGTRDLVAALLPEGLASPAQPGPLQRTGEEWRWTSESPESAPRARRPRGGGRAGEALAEDPTRG